MSADLSPEERKRFHAELRQDEEYKKNRKMLISVTAMAAVALLLVVVFVMNDLMPMWLVAVDLVLISIFYMYFAFRAARRQSEITERFRYFWGKTPKAKSKARIKKDKAKER